MDFLELNNQLPSWNLESIFEEKVPTVEDYKGKPLLILFFSLGCPGCKGRALPFANRMAYEHENKLNVIGIHTNFEGVDFTDKQLKEAKENYHIRYPYFRDYNYNTTFINYQAGGTPHWVLVNEDGTVIYSIFGSDPNNALLRLDLKIKELLQ